MSSTNVQNPKVSVCVITYNHELYIVDCLNQILSQKTNFEYNVVVGEDCSIDNTYSAINKLVPHHKSINLLESKSNLGALPNFIRTLKECKGKYIAFCEGDDYWIDEHKLQKQVDFLEQNPQYGGVCTNNRWFFENENQYKDSILEEAEITFERLCDSNKINSQTILFKRELITELDWMNGLKIGDWALHLLVTSQQPYYRLPEITTVYRVHIGGVHSLLHEEQKIRNRIDVLVAVLQNVELNSKRKDLLKKSIRNLLKKLIGYQSDDVKTIREKYFEYGGDVFNKTILNSYIK